MSKVNFFTPKEAEEDYEEYTVEIPEGLTEHFEPSQSVTDEQCWRWMMSRKEPYPGYAQELADWEAAWDDVNYRQPIADGQHWVVTKPNKLTSDD